MGFALFWYLLEVTLSEKGRDIYFHTGYSAPMWVFLFCLKALLFKQITIPATDCLSCQSKFTWNTPLKSQHESVIFNEILPLRFLTWRQSLSYVIIMCSYFMHMNANFKFFWLKKFGIILLHQVPISDYEHD